MINSVSEIPQQLAPMLVSIRRHLHMNPELGMQEHQTARYIRETLEMHGLAVNGPLAGGTGLYVDIEGAHDGPVVAYRADIDALPIQDAKDTPYASRNEGVAHLCGHDAHTALGIGVALLLSRLRGELHGTARVFFQPNEEGTPSGAPLMIRDGVLDGVSAVYAVHVDPTLPVGQFGLITGAATASTDRFKITVVAPTTGHSARPHLTADTIWIATQILNTLYQLPGRITDARSASVLTACRFHGGEAYNVIPREVEFGGTLRCTEAGDRLFLRDEMRKAATGIAERCGARAEVHFDYGAPPVMNDAMAVANVHRTVQETAGREAIHHIHRPSMGAEDFAYYLEKVPGALVRVGTADGPATRHPLHDACFDLAEDALEPAAQIMARVVINHLRNG
jgi:amidohydrolase